MCLAGDLSYSCNLRDSNDDEVHDMVGYMVEDVPPPVNGVPYTARYANDAVRLGQVNSYLDSNISEVFPTRGVRKRKRQLSVGDVIDYALRADRTIQPGEKILWDYGPHYHRATYSSKIHDDLVPPHMKRCFVKIEQLKQ